MKFKDINKFRDDIKETFIENELTEELVNYFEAPRQGQRYQTICHGGDGYNLEVHNDTATLCCYSNCGAMDIIDFTKKVTGKKYVDALLFLAEFAGIDYKEYILNNHSRTGFGIPIDDEYEEKKPTEEELAKLKEEAARKKAERIEKEKICNIEENILPECVRPYGWNCFYKFDLPIESWLKEDISKESMKKYGIGYHDPDIPTYLDGLGTWVKRSFRVNEEVYPLWVAIPCKDRFGKLVGVRIRDFGYYTDAETTILHEPDRGKYRPISAVIDPEKPYYRISFKTGSALYGIYENLDLIKEKKKCIIFEGEKSVLKADTFYNGKCPCVATFGSAIKSEQLKILQNLGVEEITIAYDYDNDDSKEKILKKAQGVKIRWPELKVYYMCSGYEDVLEPHDAPIDKGKKVFNDLYKKRQECILSEEGKKDLINSGSIEWGTYSPEEMEELMKNCPF